MIITKTVVKRGKEVNYDDLTKHSMIPIEVECDYCHRVFISTKYQIERNGHHICQQCVVRKVHMNLPNVGDRFGRLVVKQTGVVIGRQSYSICRCDCGNEATVKNQWLRNGHTKSCGCLKINAFDNVVHPKGEKHHNWKGGISGERRRTMASCEYKKFRKSVFSRDNYTCQKCGQVGGDLNVHHILAYNEYPEYRTNVNNGITLCRKCHMEFHSLYGRIGINLEMCEKYLSADK